MTDPRLYIFSGLPGTGKTTLATAVSRALHAAYLRIDTIEQGLRDLCRCDVRGEGYRLAYRIAADNLTLGTGVIADSCNPIALTRREWEAVARAAGVGFINIEVRCSDPAEHRHRVEGRRSTVPGLKLPTWPEVVDREYHAWPADRTDRVIVDTAGKTIPASIRETLAKISAAVDADKMPGPHP